jgi:hypothetical protein
VRTAEFVDDDGRISGDGLVMAGLPGDGVIDQEFEEMRFTPGFGR